MLTFGSLFAGIGGWDLGLERAGMRCVWQCEIDPFCLRVLEKHWPDVLRVRDIRQLRARDIPAVDVLCGGFPCQDISFAGKGAGIDGARSGLWSEYARLIGELRPRYVLVENVAALLARGMGVVLGDLATLGYDAEWDCIPASALGAPHRRDRLWIVAYPHGDGEPHGTVDAQAPRDAPIAGRSSADADGRGCEQWPRVFRSGWWKEPENRGWWEPESGIHRVDDGLPAGLDRGVPQPPPLAHGKIPHRVGRLKGLGNSLVPQIAEWIGLRILEWRRDEDV